MALFCIMGILLVLNAVSAEDNCLNNGPILKCAEIIKNTTFRAAEVIILDIVRLLGTCWIDVTPLPKLERIEVTFCLNCQDVCDLIKTDHDIQMFVNGDSLCNITSLIDYTTLKQNTTISSTMQNMIQTTPSTIKTDDTTSETSTLETIKSSTSSTSSTKIGSTRQMFDSTTTTNNESSATNIISTTTITTAVNNNYSTGTISATTLTTAYDNDSTTTTTTIDINTVDDIVTIESNYIFDTSESCCVNTNSDDYEDVVLYTSIPAFCMLVVLIVLVCWIHRRKQRCREISNLNIEMSSRRSSGDSVEMFNSSSYQLGRKKSI